MSSQPGRERRRLKRIVHRIAARFQTDAIAGQGHIKNICREGVFLRTGDLPEPGESVTVSFENETGEKIEVSGSVRWTTAQLQCSQDVPPGFGVHIDNPTSEFDEFFEHLLLH